MYTINVQVLKDDSVIRSFSQVMREEAAVKHFETAVNDINKTVEAVYKLFLLRNENENSPYKIYVFNTTNLTKEYVFRTRAFAYTVVTLDVHERLSTIVNGIAKDANKLYEECKFNDDEFAARLVKSFQSFTWNIMEKK